MEIDFINVALTELNFKLNKDFKPPKGGIPVEVGFKSKSSFSQDKKTLTVILSVILFNRAEIKPFKMKISVEGTFRGKDYEELKRFSKVHALAHLFPFVREIIGSTTMRANIPPLLLPPVNLSAILEKKKS
jgi:preprotein translocase subunit SecB